MVTSNDAIKSAVEGLVDAFGKDEVMGAAFIVLGAPWLEQKVGKVEHTLNMAAAMADVECMIAAFDTTIQMVTQGASDVITRIEKLQAAKAKGVPAEYFKILGPEGLDYTFTALDSAVSSQLEAGNKREAAHRDRSDLVRRRAQLETSIKLTEAEAIMNITGTGKDAYVMIGEKMTYMPNDTARDAYRRTVSKVEREELAKVNGEIAAIEADIVRAKDGWDTAKEASDTLRARANAQSALLNFLASRG